MPGQKRASRSRWHDPFPRPRPNPYSPLVTATLIPEDDRMLRAPALAPVIGNLYVRKARAANDPEAGTRRHNARSTRPATER